MLKATIFILTILCQVSPALAKYGISKPMCQQLYGRPFRIAGDFHYYFSHGHTITIYFAQRAPGAALHASVMIYRLGKVTDKLPEMPTHNTQRFLKINSPTRTWKPDKTEDPNFYITSDSKLKAVPLKYVLIIGDSQMVSRIETIYRQAMNEKIKKIALVLAPLPHQTPTFRI